MSMFLQEKVQGVVDLYKRASFCRGLLDHPEKLKLTVKRIKHFYKAYFRASRSSVCSKWHF